MKYLFAGLILLLLAGGGVWYFLERSDTAFSVIIDNPRSGDILRPGDKSNVIWHTYNFKKINPDWVNNVTLRVSIVDANQTPTEARNSGDNVVVDNFPFTEQGSMPFTVPAGISPGQYQLKMSFFGSGNNTPNQLWGLEYRTNGTFTVK